ncbi:class A beta-lactamase [Patulibacter americanus]|uniref:class A beta-lactamase n=1 Tax=Patulibacter americanus TaxID=588672 RepID=UPI0003B5356F|nr:class A beta-lactamase [Patulibacter americanus]
MALRSLSLIPLSLVAVAAATPLVACASASAPATTSAAVAPISAAAPTRPADPSAPRARPADRAEPSRQARPAFARLEREHTARLGVIATDTGTGRTVSYRAGERFAFASTSKALTAGLLLQRASDRDLRRVVRYRPSDLLEYAPVTRRHVATGMTLRGLTIAALQHSDNTAANLVMRELGGPRGVERGLRALGDRTTEVERTEPTLNTAIPGERRDTTTPRAIARDLRSFVLGTALTPPRRALLARWMVGNTTGGKYVRAGVPAGWVVADKTGSAGYGTRNDIAVVWPPQGRPIVVAVLSDRRRDPSRASDDALIARATRTAVRAVR